MAGLPPFRRTDCAHAKKQAPADTVAAAEQLVHQDREPGGPLVTMAAVVP
jgi:hypothetical protein